MPICTTLTRAALLVVILGTGVALSSQDPGADGRSIPGPAEVSRQGAAGVNGIGINSADGLAIHGFDPVAYVDDYQAVRGKAEFEASWQGARWRFSSSEERRVGKEWVSTCRTRWSPSQYKKK